MSSGKKLTAEQKAARALKASRTKFEALSKAEKRVAIAKDVIAQVKAKQMKAATGYGYVAFDSAVTAKPDQCLYEVVDKNRKDCFVCGIGALFCSALKLKNKFDVADLGYHSYEESGSVEIDEISHGTVAKYMKPWFSELQLDLVETAFEGYTTGLVWDMDGDTAERISSFCGNEGDADARLVAIMQNIVDNNGTFKP